MDLFAPSFVPAMTPSHQPAMSGLSVPAAAPARALGPTTAVHFGRLRPLRGVLLKPVLQAMPVVSSATPRASNALDTRG